MKIICHNTQYWASSVLIFTLFAEWYFNKLSPISSDFHVSMVDTACFIKEKEAFIWFFKYCVFVFIKKLI